MSNFAKKTEEQSKRAWERKTLNAKLYHDLAKLSFAVPVVGQITNINNGSIDYVALIAGLLLTAILITIGNNFITK